MDIVNKAIAKASDLASEAGWNAQHRVKVSTEEKRLDDLRGKAMSKRAEIGEAMFTMWQAHKLPPSQLDGLFYELQDLADAVGGASANLAALKAETYEQATTAQAYAAQSYAAAVPALPPSPLGAAPLPALTSGAAATDIIDATPEVPLTECPSCHSMVRADRSFCGRCGQKLYA
jgi:hypothetical protein